MAGPCLPPFNAPSRVLRSRPAMGFAKPWHCIHFWDRMGATSRVNDIVLAVCASTGGQTPQTNRVQTKGRVVSNKVAPPSRASHDIAAGAPSGFTNELWLSFL